MKILYVLIIMVLCFMLNLFIYYISDDYRNFLKNFKQTEDNQIVLKDDYEINIKNDIKKTLEKKEEIVIEKSPDELAEEKLRQKVAFIRAEEEREKQLKEKQKKVNRIINKIEKKENIKEIIKEKREELKSGFKKIKVVKSKKLDNISLSEYDRKVLNLFKKYNFVRLESHGDLLDVTSEYPDEYFEYYTMDLTLLIFPTKSYNEIKDIFSVESNGYNFMLNEVDNFGDESFYINLGDDYKDGYIRVIFTKNNRTFGFKVLKTEYSNVKNILKNL